MKLYIAGFGPGSREGMTLAAEAAVNASDIIVGYTVYTDLMKQFFPEKHFVSTAMRQERDRVAFALEQAARGRNVALICSGDSVIYGMAGLALELAENYVDIEIEIIPGVTAALSGSAILGAPLTNDFAVISLSDLLTPWDKIEKRLECAALGDFSIAIYNPSSRKRRDHLRRACDILLRHKAPETICGYVRSIGRKGEEKCILTLGELREREVDMFTTVFIGSSETKMIGDRMVTPRGYKNV